MIKTIRLDWYFIIPATIAFFSALIITWWDFVKIQEISYRMNLINITGLLLFVIGIVIRRIGKRTLGKYYTYGLRTLQNHELITHGIYKHVRHPISLAMFMYGTGIPLIFTSFYGFLIMLILIPLTLYRIRIEEKMLIEKFGDEYKEYMTRTKKIIPFIY
ncbi:MAG: methyltransferase family protein [Candidatus Hodarchaeota archaeon]